MRNETTKISLFILIALILSACNTLKKVPNEKLLLAKNEILINGKKESNEDITKQLYQKPNSSLLGYRLRLNIFNLATTNPDSIYKSKFIKNPEKYTQLSKWLSKKQVDRLGNSFYYSGIHTFLKKTGEAPVILDNKSTKRSLLRLQSYYFDKGYFNTKGEFKIDSVSKKKARVNYTISTGNPFILDTILVKINTPLLDSLYKINKGLTFLRSGKQYKKLDFDAERNRITADFRNNGAYYFQQNYVNYAIDTLNSNNKANIDINIENQSIREGDSTKILPFRLYKISDINIYTDNLTSKDKSKITDSVTYNNFNLFSKLELKFRPKAITDAIFITKGSIFSDTKTTLTSRALGNLRVFNYPSIQYTVDPRDATANSLIANIYLSPRKKLSFGYNFDFTHSAIQDIGITASTSVSIRNIFRGAETLEIAARGNIGSSKEVANIKNNFFNVSEYGVDMKLHFPRLFFALKTDRIIPKSMLPFTSFAIGYAKQENIGLDKQNFTSSMNYNWNPKQNIKARFELLNVQFVKNVNTSNYFNIYKSSYNVLNSLAQNSSYGINPSYFNSDNNLIIESGTNGFTNDVLGANPTVIPSTTDYKTIRSIEERRNRLTENDLIASSSYSYSETTKKDQNDNDFMIFRGKLESAGNLLSLLARASKQLKNQDVNSKFFEVQYSQYIKMEGEFIKLWDLRRKRILAIRSFAGIAIPYGNSNDIPFSRSYFAGGTNDNRAWQSYGLGPGSSSGINDFNEANLKLALSAELRFNIFGQLNGALFVDAGNIWNVLDNVDDEKSVFKNLNSLKNSAIGSGFGLRYDFNFFVIRLDFGFKTYNPADEESNRWFRDYNFANSVVNIGINYPF
ncbi:MAG: outer membrane protein assembly factor [Flavobacteriaceae bacterium]|nr:outer membrane protein assembly factor [Flavobacteriaceae bacterium]